MRKELQDQLYALCPKLYADKDAPDHKSCMHYGIGCGNGWFDIIKELSITLEKIIESDGGDIRAAQVKQKFGGLRFYLDGDLRNAENVVKVNEALIKAETAADSACEVCGKPATRRSGSWITTMCDEHADNE